MLLTFLRWGKQYEFHMKGVYYTNTRGFFVYFASSVAFIIPKIIPLAFSLPGPD